jgi:hypothetical protein
MTLCLHVLVLSLLAGGTVPTANACPIVNPYKKTPHTIPTVIPTVNNIQDLPSPALAFIDDDTPLPAAAATTRETRKRLSTTTFPCLWSPLTVRLLLGMSVRNSLSKQILLIPLHPSTSSTCVTSKELRTHAVSWLGLMTSSVSSLDWWVSLIPSHHTHSTPSACMALP